ncbi:SMI1/KNR4 family protein [Calothrix sp. CCY 0018]|uniref:SMI1/KNR4 family protein n=1 Tax=Calothrix sp. CCY 0018 TaxID=3103864 RepID=UPI0039C60512
MSALTETLEFIFNWMMLNMPNHPAKMTQGLSREAIEAKVQQLPFYLPEEIYELYEWRNGGVNPFIPHPNAWDLATFFSLEESISESKEWKGDFHLFPIFVVEDCGYFIVGTKDKSETGPIYCNDIPQDVVEQQKPLYPSLTSIMQRLAEELEDRVISAYDEYL